MSHAGTDPGGGAGLNSGLCEELAAWASGFDPSDEDLALAERALLDTVGVLLGGRGGGLEDVLEPLSEAGRWAALAHVLDFDDLHLPSTAHISAVCVPVALAAGGGAQAYLAGAGVMARLGAVLGWRHYAAGWHATCTAGAPAAAAAAAVAQGLNADGISTAMALAVPAAGGVQRAFGTQAKSLQVAFAVESGIRAAALAAAGAQADPRALDDWVKLVGGDPAGLASVSPEQNAIPGGLAVKVYPCCYALQRPIAAVRELGRVDAVRELGRVDAVRELGRVEASRVRGIEVRTPASALAPLIHHRPKTGLEGKFSLEYGLACALLDDPIRLHSFSDQAVARPEARGLIEAVEVVADSEGEGLLSGQVVVAVRLDDGRVLRSELELPPGAPERPMSEDDLRHKLRVCVGAAADEVRHLGWATAAEFLRSVSA